MDFIAYKKQTLDLVEKSLDEMHAKFEHELAILGEHIDELEKSDSKVLYNDLQEILDFAEKDLQARINKFGAYSHEAEECRSSIARIKNEIVVINKAKAEVA